MILGTDTSRYQSLGTYDPGEFEIVNVDEPDHGGDFTATIERNVTEGRPWGVYVWVYPGRPVTVRQAVERVRGLGHGDPPLGYWWDYEEAGVEPWQLDDAFHVADALGVKSGYYSNAHTIDHRPFADRPWWLAAYPGRNDGTFPGLAAMGQPPRPVQLWQFTSSANAPVGLDRNVVVDEDWYRSWIAAPLPAEEEDDMPYLVQSPGGVAEVVGTDTTPVDADRRDRRIAEGWKLYEIDEAQMQRLLAGKAVAFLRQLFPKKAARV